MRILIIEDEFSLAEVLAETLKKANYAADAVYDGEAGYLQALTGIYDAVILDVMLPGLNGYQVLTRLRREGIKTPVLMLTAKSELEDKILGLDSGADDYLTKPFETGELLARLRAVTRRQGAIEKEILSCGDLLLDVKQCEIRHKDTQSSVTLGGKEFQLLEFLMRNQNQVITREQIAEKIWGYDCNAEYNNVEVYVSFIRRKINFVHSAAKIRAVRGIGYLLEGQP